MWSTSMNKIVFLVLLTTCCSLAWRRGGAPERAVAFILFSATLLTMVAAASPHVVFQSLETGIFVIDVAAFLALAAVALFANRTWPMVIAALQLVTIFSHIVALMKITLPWTYAFLLSIWSYPMLLVLVIGTWRHSGRVRQHLNGSGPRSADWVERAAGVSNQPR